MARHRSPRGRGAYRIPQSAALDRSTGRDAARRAAPSSTPLRRGAAAVVVTGGALSLAGAAATIPLLSGPPATSPEMVTVAAVLPATPGATALPDGSALDDRSVLPTRTPVAAEPPAPGSQLDTARLVKAVQLEERRITASAAGRRAADARTGSEAPAEGDEEQPTATLTPKRADSGCDLDTSALGAVKPHVRRAAFFVGCRFDEPTVLGVAGRSGSSDHPTGKALDFMVDKATGNAVAGCVLRNQEALGVSYVIWRQRINFGSGWKPMEDRGSPTANHMDHVHVSFGSAAGGTPATC